MLIYTHIFPCSVTERYGSHHISMSTAGSKILFSKIVVKIGTRILAKTSDFRTGTENTHDEPGASCSTRK